MELERHTLLVVSAGGLLALALVFGTTVMLRHDDRSNRLWVAGTVAAFGALALPGLWWQHDAPSRPVVGTAAALVVLAPAALWSGLRCFTGRSPRLAASLGAAVATGVVVAVVGTGHAWPLVVSDIVAAVFAACGAVTLERGPMTGNLNSRLLQVALVGHVLLTVLVTPTLTATNAGPAGGLAFGATLDGCLYVIALMLLSAMRVERYGSWWTHEEERHRFELGILTAAAFDEEAHDRLGRSRHAGASATLLLVALSELDALNTAFGRAAGDAALELVAGVLRTHVPPSALVGHLGAGVFGVLTGREPELLVRALRTGMLDADVPARVPMRVDPQYASSTSADVGYEYEALRARAETMLAASVVTGE